MMKTEWLNILGSMSYGIYILTTAYEDKINGMIASWVSQVSYEPPLILAAIHPDRYTHNLMENSGYFVLHFLDRQQKGLIKQFKGPDPALKFESMLWERGKTRCPVLKDCLGFIECEVKEKYSPGNHTLFIGEIVHASMEGQGAPLSTLDYEGFYSGKN